MTEVVSGGISKTAHINLGRATERLTEAGFDKFTVDVHRPDNNITLTTEIDSDEKNQYNRVTAELAREGFIEDRGVAAAAGSRR